MLCRWREEETRRVKEGLQVGLTTIKLSTAQMIRALGQNEKLDRAELEKAMSTLVEQLDEMANLANLHTALQTDHSVKDTVTQLCTDLDGMFNEVADVFKKKQQNTEVHSDSVSIHVSFKFLHIPAEEGAE